MGVARRIMLDAKLRHALELRYDGPIPANASVAPDFHLRWSEQLESRKRGSWQDVRRLGRLAAHARQCLRDSDDMNSRGEWARQRRKLAFALRSWAAYRNLLRAGPDHGSRDDGSGGGGDA